jgi:hypothetical protein
MKVVFGPQAGTQPVSATAQPAMRDAPMRRSHIFRWVWRSLLLLAVLVAVWVLFSGGSIRAHGVIGAEIAELRLPLAGRLGSVHVAAGDRVGAGEILLAYRPRPDPALAGRLSQERLEAQAALAALEAGSSLPDGAWLAEEQALENLRRSAVDSAIRAAERERLVQSAAAEAAALDSEADSLAAQATARYSRLADLERLVRLGAALPRDVEILRQEAALLQARAEAARARAQAARVAPPPAPTAQDPAAVERLIEALRERRRRELSARSDAAQARVTEAERQIAELAAREALQELRAPSNAVVERIAAPGSDHDAQAVVAGLITGNRTWVDAFVRSRDAGRLGGIATVRISSLDGRTLFSGPARLGEALEAPLPLALQPWLPGETSGVRIRIDLPHVAAVPGSVVRVTLQE